MRRRELTSGSIALGALAFAVLAVGGATRWAAAGVAALAAAALVTMLSSRRAFARVPPLLALLCALAGLSLLQLVPLPVAVLGTLQPVGNALRTDGAALLDVEPWPALTLDAPGTLLATTFLVTLLGIAIIATRIAATERGRLLCLGGVAVICGIAAAIVGVHQLFGATSLYGLYAPVQATPPVLGPLLNANHLGGLMALGTVVAVGLLFYTKQSNAARVAWLAITAGCTAVALATLSRGAMLAMLVGLGTTLAAIIAQRVAPVPTGTVGDTRKKFLITTLPLVIVAACAFLVILYTSAGTAADQLNNTSLAEIHEPKSKFAAWRSTTLLISESPWLGVGRGAFEPVFTRVHPASGFVTFSHTENEYLQAVVEWGIPGAAVIVLGLGWLGVVALRRWRDGPLIAASIGGLATIAVHSSVDFGMQLLGFALPATLVAASAGYVPLTKVPTDKLTRLRVLRGIIVASLLASAFVLFTPLTRSVANDHRELGERPTLSAVRDLVERHPLDYYGYAIAAEIALRERNPAAVSLLNHALILHPTHSGLHRLAGRILLATGRVEQAAIEYAAALRFSPDPRTLIREIATTFPPHRAPEAIPVDYENVDLITRTLVADGHGAVALRWLQRVVKVHPRSISELDRMYTLALAHGDPVAAEEAARLRVQLSPTPATKLQLAQLLAKRSQHDEVLELLGDVGMWRGKVRDQLTAWLQLCDSYLALRRFDDATQCVRRADASGLVTQSGRLEIQKRLDAITEARLAAPPP